MSYRAVVALIVVLAGCVAPPEGEAPTTPAMEPGIGGHPVTHFEWAQLPEGPRARTEVVVGQLGREFLVIGGFTADSMALLPTGVVDVYDVDADAWRAGPDYPIPIHHSTAVQVDDELYVLGGLTEGFAPTHLAYRIGPSPMAWVPIAPLPEPRGSHAAAVIDGKIYVAGGVGADGAHLDSVIVYDPGAATWSTVGEPIPTPRDHTAGAAIDGKFLVAAGDMGGHDDNTDATEAFDPSTGEWSRLAPVPTLRGSIAAAAWRNHLVVLGGQNGTQTFDTVEAYDATNDSWVELPPMNSARHGFGAGVLDDALYVFYGGPEPGLSVTASVERLSLASGSTSR